MSIHGLSKEKAKTILHDKEVRGHPLTEKQRKFFGARASGMPVKKKQMEAMKKKMQEK